MFGRIYNVFLQNELFSAHAEMVREFYHDSHDEYKDNGHEQRIPKSDLQGYRKLVKPLFQA